MYFISKRVFDLFTCFSDYVIPPCSFKTQQNVFCIPENNYNEGRKKVEKKCYNIE